MDDIFHRQICFSFNFRRKRLELADVLSKDGGSYDKLVPPTVNRGPNDYGKNDFRYCWQKHTATWPILAIGKNDHKFSEFRLRFETITLMLVDRMKRICFNSI